MQRRVHAVSPFVTHATKKSGVSVVIVLASVVYLELFLSHGCHDDSVGRRFALNSVQSTPEPSLRPIPAKFTEPITLIDIVHSSLL